MEKTCLIRQPAGLGDIIFCQKIAKLLLSKGKCNKIIWPVIKPFNYIKEYLQDPRFDFVCEDEQFPFSELYYSNIINLYQNDDVLYIPLQYADRTFPDVPVLDSKYQLVNLNHNDWLDYFNFTRNIEKENSLYYKILNLKDDDEYVLVNSLYGSPPHSVKSDLVTFNTDKKVVEIEYISDYNLFDWCKVIENASEIYFVDTSFTYLFEKLELRAKRIDMFSDRQGPSKNIFKKLYNWI